MTCEEEIVDARPIDAPEIDAIPNGCYGGGLFVVCPDQAITGQKNLTISTVQTLDTSASPLCEPYHLLTGPDSSFCVIAQKSVSIGVLGRWNVTGTKPLVVIGAMSIDVLGAIDVASHRDGSTGPAANASQCIAGTTPINDQGGPGGSFGTVGGGGGNIDAALPIAAGGATPNPTTLRGGCPGATGNGANGGAFGRGGGAVYLISDSLTVTGTINASGASGHGAGLSAGGGGGGSGGMIVLDAPTITVSAGGRIFANGGAGGEGGGGSNGGNDGNDSTAPTSAAIGGANNAGAGGNGGNGALGTTPAGTGDNGADSGGGGGGGVGVIRVFPSRMIGGSISPPPT